MSENNEAAADLSFRPDSYFWARGLGLPLVPAIQGVERRRLYERALAEGEPLPEGLFKPVLTPAERRSWGGIHPAMMGGEYLPAMRPNEVEIARIVIASTTCDVTCVYARPRSRGALLRVVDEYDGDTLDGRATRMAKRPLSLGELLDFFLTAWDLMGVLEANFSEHGYAEDDVQGFITSATSGFYPGFELALRQRVSAWLIEVRDDDSDEDEDEEGENEEENGGERNG